MNIHCAKWALCVVSLMVFLMGPAWPAQAGEPGDKGSSVASPGSADFQPSAKCPLGWRGDGSGCYPNATPPIRWGSAVPLKGFLYQSTKPKDESPSGNPLDDGVIRNWFVAGPVDAPMDATNDTEIVKGESDFAPATGDKAGDSEWKETAADGSFLGFATLFANRTNVAGYAHACIYAPADAALAGSFVFGGPSVVWVNAKPVLKIADKGVQWAVKSVSLPLKKGWNRLLIRTMPGTQNKVYSAFVYASFRGDSKGQVEARNVLWSTSTGGTTTPAIVSERLLAPLGGAAAPTVVGDRLFLQAEPYDLVCLDRNSGKVLWARSNNYFEATPEADRKAKAEFEEAGKLAAEINALNEGWAATGGLTKEQLLAKDAAQKKLYDLMKKIDETKYSFTKEQDLGMAGFVPVTDGKNIWAWYVSGIAACYDLDGKRKWIALDNRGGQHHGFATSPLLIDGKLVVYMGDIRCLDAQTGASLWVKAICKDTKDHWSSAFTGSLAALHVGGVAMFVTPNGDIHRVSDGEKVFGDRSMYGMIQRPSPVVAGDTVFKLDSGGTLHILKMPKEAGDRLEPVSNVRVKLDASANRLFFGDCWQASPVVHEGLVYCLHNSGLLSVVDAEKGQVVYQKLLELDVQEGWSLIRPSLAMAGAHIYALGSTGTCVVFEPGREFKLIARNRVSATAGIGQWWQHAERFAASPAFDGKRMYLRGDVNLYGIEEKP